MLTVEASSFESAVRLRDSFSEFDADVLDGNKGSCSVTVMLEERQTTAVLSVIERHVMERDRGGGGARIHLDGCCYMLHTG
jgi:hypothetical protein